MLELRKPPRPGYVGCFLFCFVLNKKNNEFIVLITRRGHHEGEQSAPPPPHTLPTLSIYCSLLSLTVGRGLGIVWSTFGRHQISRYISHSPHSESVCGQSWMLESGLCNGSPLLLTRPTGVLFKSIPWPRAHKAAEGFREEWGGAGKKREIWSNRPAQHCPLTSQQTRLRRFYRQDSFLETFYLHTPGWSSSSPAHNHISLQSFLGCQCWKSQHIWACSWTKILQEITSLNARLGELCWLDEKGGNPQSLQGKIDLTIKAPEVFTDHLQANNNCSRPPKCGFQLNVHMVEGNPP